MENDVRLFSMKAKIYILNAFKNFDENDSILWNKYYKHLLECKTLRGGKKMLNQINSEKTSFNNYRERILIKVIAKSNVW